MIALMPVSCCSMAMEAVMTARTHRGAGGVVRRGARTGRGGGLERWGAAPPPPPPPQRSLDIGLYFRVQSARHEPMMVTLLASAAASTIS